MVLMLWQVKGRVVGYRIIADSRCTHLIFHFPFVSHSSLICLHLARVPPTPENILIFTSASARCGGSGGEERDERGAQTRAKYRYKDIWASPECWWVAGPGLGLATGYQTDRTPALPHWALSRDDISWKSEQSHMNIYNGPGEGRHEGDVTQSWQCQSWQDMTSNMTPPLTGLEAMSAGSLLRV